MAIEQIRTLLLVGLAVVTFLLWDAWQKDYGPKPTPAQTVQRGSNASEGGAPASPTGGDVPDAPVQVDGAPQTGGAPAAAIAPAGEIVSVETDTLVVDLEAIGGTVSRIGLRKYPVVVNKPDEPFIFLDRSGEALFIAQSGLLGPRSAPNHHATFSPQTRKTSLANGADHVRVPMVWRSDDGIEVTKTYTFPRDSYAPRLTMTVINRSTEPWSGRLYGQFQREEPIEEGGLFRTYTYTGAVLSGPEKPYEKVDFDDLAQTDVDRDVTGGWAAMIQHYFAAAWIPDQSETNHYYSKALPDGRYVIGVITPAKTIPAGSSGEFALTLYAGPKDQDRMAAVAPHLERTVDYGWLFLIAEPLFWALQKIHGFVGNWGWSIILLTMLIKAVFFHLSAASYKSMAKMRKLQPRITTLRERYSADRQRMNQAMMQLYKDEKINPLGGCFPILVQIPVFISLYWMLLESVELRQAPFMFWLTDLSLHDPYFVLPVAMGVTMLIQQRLNPAPPDPMQAKIMMALPFVFTFFFLFFPSGLVLYWFVNNVLSIIQQWVITKKIIGET